MQYYILLLYYIVEYTLRTNNGIIFMLFTSFITFIYTFYCYSFITRLFAFAFVGDAVGDRYKPIIYQVIRLSGRYIVSFAVTSTFRLQASGNTHIVSFSLYHSSLCSSFQYCTYIVVRLHLHSGTLHSFAFASYFWIASYFSKKQERSKEKRSILYIILYIFFLCILILFIFFCFFSFLSLFLLFLSCFCMYVFVCSKSMFYNT